MNQSSGSQNLRTPLFFNESQFSILVPPEEIRKLGLATHLGEGVRYYLFPAFGLVGLLLGQKAQMQEDRDFETQELAGYPLS